LRNAELRVADYNSGIDRQPWFPLGRQHVGIVKVVIDK